MNMRIAKAFVAGMMCLLICTTGRLARAQPDTSFAGQSPQAEIPAPRDRTFAGAIKLQVYATDTDRSIFSVAETIPVQSSGDMVLLYPEWEIGSHAPTASPVGLAGLTVSVDGHRVEWRRDTVNMHAFHVPLPAAARTLHLAFQYLSPSSAGWLRPEMVDIQWQRLLLYPAGWFTRDITVSASLRIRDGLRAFTSLKYSTGRDGTLEFGSSKLEYLVDAPVYAARAWRTIKLAPGARQPVNLDLLADDAADLNIDSAEADRLRSLVAQTEKVFGSPPFRHYDMLVSLSDSLSPGGGIEHLEEGENNLPGNYFLTLPGQLNNRDLIAHELVHAWNGRFRQPNDLWTPTFNQPSAGTLLWVYERQTEFWGRVLASRAGMRSKQETIDKIALDAALVAERSGRQWKSLEDSSNDAVYMAGRSVNWRDWQRREDYYSEGVLLWLDVDARLRELTGDQISLDDFAARFFKSEKLDMIVSTYTFADVCQTLGSLVRSNWSSFLRQHLESHRVGDALVGLSRAGWKLVFKPIPTETFRQDESQAGGADLTYSIGAVVDESGRVSSVSWNSPAFQAGIAPGTNIVSVNEKLFSLPALLDAVADTPTKPIQLMIKWSGHKRTLSLAYGGGARYPWLERVDGAEDRLSRLLATR